MAKEYPVIAHAGSIGGGMQSTTMFLMACHGLITPRMEFGVFADTGWEPKTTYETIEFLTDYGEQHGIPLYTVQWRNIREAMLDNGNSRKANMPLYIRNSKGQLAQLRRQCTKDYKLDPIRRKIKELTGCSLKRPVSQWIGISTDEATRMSPSGVRYVKNRYPLIEKRMSRSDCHNWIKKHGFPMPSKSSCIGCPYHSNDTWSELSEEELADAIEFDEQIRERELVSEMGMSRRESKNRPNEDQHTLFEHDIPAKTTEDANRVLDNRQFLHQSGQPLKDRPFERRSADQLELGYDPETEECSGGCFL